MPLLHLRLSQAPCVEQALLAALHRAVTLVGAVDRPLESKCQQVACSVQRPQAAGDLPRTFNMVRISVWTIICGQTRKKKDAATTSKIRRFAANYLYVSMQILPGKVQRKRAVSAEGEHELVRHRAWCFHAYVPTATRIGLVLPASAKQALQVLTKIQGLPVSVRYAQRELSRILWAVRCALSARTTPTRRRAAPP